MHKLHILHVSDLHYEEIAKTKHAQIGRALISDLQHIKATENISPDIVIFSGDLINRGSDGKEAYQGVSTYYIEPLLAEMGLTQDNFFSVPGNHDVDRNRTYKEFESGLAAELINSDSLNQYYQSCLKHPERYLPIRPKLESYTAFENSYENGYLIYKDEFVAIDQIEIKGIRIAICRFNSAWRSSGFDSDFGRLLIPSDAIDHAVSLTSDADLKVAVAHHPIGWLSDWNEREIQNRLAKNFNFYFCGHLHDSNGVLFQQILGGIFISSAGCLKSGKLSNYSLVSIDLQQDTVTTRFRKWYPDRDEFDQETEKAKNGTVVFSGVKLNNQKVQERLRFSEYRSKLRSQLRSDKVVNPLEGIVDLDVDDVFIEPYIRDTSVHNREEEKPNTFEFATLLAEKNSLIFYGGKESGKSTLLLRINELELKSQSHSEKVEIPIRISFRRFSKQNPDAFVKELRRSIDDVIEIGELVRMLNDGLVVLLVDDLGDRNADDRNRKLDVFIEFLRKFPKVRVVCTILESVRPFSCERIDLLKGLLSSKTFYLWPFTATRLRQLLIKVASCRKQIGGGEVNIDRMMDQIIYYFKNLQIPITPLAATLFIGVLFRDIKQKNIQNEAYLIENYSRDILEKIGTSKIKNRDLEYPDKVAFLAHVAAAMHSERTFEWPLERYNAEKYSYFGKWGEDPPSDEVFDQFFDKGVLDLYAGNVAFKFKFWFNFFLAKAMSRDKNVATQVLDREDYLRFRIAISYKAGLLRNDVDLLEEISKRLIEAGTEFGKGSEPFEGMLDISSQVSHMLPLIEEEIRQKNTAVSVDGTHEEDLFGLSANGEAADNEVNIVDLLTLHSEIIKHTREVAETRKVELILLNVRGYIGLMYIFNETFSELIEKMTLADMAKFMFPKDESKTGERRLKALVSHGRRMIWRLVPTSVALYAADHLAAARLARSFVTASKTEGISEFEQAMYLMLAFRADFQIGLCELESRLKKGLNPMSEFVIQGFVQIVAQESRMSEVELERTINLLSGIVNKYAPKGLPNQKNLISGPSVRDQVKKRLRINRDEK